MNFHLMNADFRRAIGATDALDGDSIAALRLNRCTEISAN
jgi:hypothetical protein